jgi:hypothetical protein
VKLIFLLSLDFTIGTNTKAVFEVTQELNPQNVALLEIKWCDFLTWTGLPYFTRRQDRHNHIFTP